MARVYRPTYTRKVPATAEPCTHKGKPAVRWKGRAGKWVYGVLCANPERCRVETSKYAVRYTDHEGRPRTARGYQDRGASEYKLHELTTTAARIHAGQLPPQSARPRMTLTELLDRWRSYVAASGASPTGAARQWQRCRDVCDGVGAIRVADLTPSAVLGWVAERREADRHKRRGFSAGTASNYVGSCKSFTRWCCVVEKCEPTDHLAALKKTRDETDTRRQRRALSPADLDQFLDITKMSAEVRAGLTGAERHALYLLACSTGLRAIEISRLTPADFDAERFEVTVERSAKNKRREVLPVPPQVMKVVRKLFQTKCPIFPNRVKPSAAWWLEGADMVRADLAAAGLQPVVNGRVFDFHALRGQFATDLDRAGVSLTRAQQLMRHSDPKLTVKHYTRPDAEERAADVAKLRRGRR